MCCDFASANTFKILHDMKVSTLATGLPFGAMIASNNYIEC